MKAISFGNIWIRLLSSCISLVSYSLLMASWERILFHWEGWDKGILCPLLSFSCVSRALVHLFSMPKGEVKFKACRWLKEVKVLTISFLQMTIYCFVGLLKKNDAEFKISLIFMRRRRVKLLISKSLLCFSVRSNIPSSSKQEILQEVGGFICGNYDK